MSLEGREKKKNCSGFLVCWRVELKMVEAINVISELVFETANLDEEGVF